MADASYTPQGGIRIEQGGVRLAVGSTGSLDVESGGEIDIESGGKLKLGGTQINSTNGTLKNQYSRDAVQSKVATSTKSSGGVALANHGLSLLSSSGSTGGRGLFRLPAPAAGIRKTLLSINATTGKTVVVETTATGVSIGYVKTYHRLTFNAKDEAVVLEGVSATKWGIASNVNAVALSTAFST